jgi:competence protein ComEA
MNFLSKTFAALLLALAFAGSAQANERININTADAATLDRVMDGVGPAKAAAIVEHRRVHGPFRTIDQLVNVKGIGPATLELNRARIMVGGAPATAPATVRTATNAPRPTAPAPRVH